MKGTEAKHRPKARGNGQGTVYQLPNRKWRAEVTLGYETKPDGRKRRICATKSDFTTKRDAVAYLPLLRQEKQDEQEKKKEEARTYTFKALYEKWAPTHNRTKSTMDCYAAAMNYYKPIWYMNISDIDIDDLQDCVDDCDKGKRTKKNMKTVAGLIYDFGIPRHAIPENLNLARFIVVRGDDETTHKSALTMAEIEKLRQKIDKVPYANYVYAQCYLGFRPSEFLALKVENYNSKEHAFVGGAKTEAGTNRIVTISPKVQGIVDALTSGKSTGSVFCDAEGNTLSIRRYRDIFYDVLDGCGIENPITVVDGKETHKLTPHSCRHTFATLMKRVDGADKDKLELIGHTSGEMLRHYQDVDYDDLRKITDAL